MTVALIVAATKEGYIGNDNTLSWFLPSDLKWFKELTLNNKIVMGRKTYDSIGKPLPKRINQVISRTLAQKEGIEIFSSIETWKCQNKEDIESKTKKIFIIGGSEIYNQTFDLATEIYISELYETENQRKSNKFDRKINFSAKMLIDSKKWILKLHETVTDQNSWFKFDSLKEKITYEKFIFERYKEIE